MSNAVYPALPGLKPELRKTPSFKTEVSTTDSGREFAISGAFQVIAGVGIAAQVLIGRRVVEGLLDVGDGTKQFDDVVPALLLMVLVVALIGFANQARMEQQRLLGELVARHATDRVLQTATAVDLLAFDSPSFLNRLQRARANAAARPGTRR